MRLQIITTHYKEKPEIVYNFLDCLKVQQFVNFADFEVIIVNDGNFEPLDKEKLHSYPFNITNITKEWGGISEARELGMNEATADYIMFCDCDDMFISVDAIINILAQIDSYKRDFIVTSILSDHICRDNVGAVTYSAKENASMCMVHGKIIRRQFLIDNNIHWNNVIKTWHEDFYFMSLVLAAQPTISLLDTAVYLWKNTPGSVTDIASKDREVFEIQRNFVEYDILALLKQRNYQFFTIKLIDSLYNCYYWNEQGKKLAKPIDTLALSKKIMATYKEDFLKLSTTTIFNRINKYDKSLIIPTLFLKGSFMDWLKASMPKESE